jgi:high affinity Mn2+ porin
MMPETANGSVMDLNLIHAHAFALEFEKHYYPGGREGIVHILAYLNRAKMGNYRKAVDWGIENSVPPAVDSVGVPGNLKYGFGISFEQPLSDHTGVFIRAGWNDGLNETWVFTEIDRHISAGVVLNGSLWHRKDDVLGLAQVINGISKDHRDYLAAGGYGFIIGDGNLNYKNEYITELYYSFRVTGYPFWFSPDYQFVINPAYNSDRGPVHAFGIRAHCEF